MFVESGYKRILDKTDKRVLGIYPDLEAQRGRREMVMDAREGSYGREPWAVMNLDRLERMSLAVYMVGFLVGHAGYSSNNVARLRKELITEDFDERLLPVPVRQRTA